MRDLPRNFRHGRIEGNKHRGNQRKIRFLPGEEYPGFHHRPTNRDCGRLPHPLQPALHRSAQETAVLPVHPRRPANPDRALRLLPDVSRRSLTN